MKNRSGVDWSKAKDAQSWSRPGLDRRVFFRHAGAAVAGSFFLPGQLARGMAAGAGRAKNVVFVLLAGGISHSDTFDLKEGAWTPRAFEPASHGGIRWPRGLMPQLSEQLKDIALVRSVRARSLVHGLARTNVLAWRETGGGPEERTMPAFVLFDAANPAAEQARFSSGELESYGGGNGFARACLAARDLLKPGQGARFVQITMGGWDNHADIYQTALNATDPNSRARQFDAGLGALLADLKRNRMLNETLVVAMSEFGRTVGPLNARAGRDHLPAQSVLMAGAGIRGGRAIGATDEMGRDVAEPGWLAGREIRAGDIAATIYAALGVDWTKSHGGYQPVSELWG